MSADRIFPELLPDSADERPEGDEAEEDILREFQAFLKSPGKQQAQRMR